ncbi:hypothetical protein V2G26_014627 [Clonostachys chloroleuca]
MSRLAHHDPPASSAADDGSGFNKLDDSPTVGRRVHVPVPLSVASPAYSPRTQRPPIPSPLSASSWTVRSSPSPSPRQDSFLPPHSNTGNLGPRHFDNTRSNSGSGPEEHTTFYSDSSRDPSPEPQNSRRCSSPTAPDDSRIVSDPLAPRLASDSQKSPKPAMSGPVGTAQENSQSAGLPRTSSIDSAISALSSNRPAQQHGSQDSGYGAADVSSLVNKAGSPEAVIQTLLKERQAQSQQNTQLWRLVDKQRAMILGLNKDLERALKEKEKYRLKLRDLLANAAFSPTSSNDLQTPSRPNVPRIDVNQSSMGFSEASSLDSPSQTFSPIDSMIPPYPVTPITPASLPDQSAMPPPPDAPRLQDPSRILPKVRDQAPGRVDRDTEEKSDQVPRLKKEDSLKDLQFNASQPPTRALPPDPPKGPSTKLGSPTAMMIEARVRSEGGVAGFPAPPRKAPPAPLQLNSPTKELVQEEETDSDLDEILESADLGSGSDDRGRRRTRAEDELDRGLRVQKEAEARSASKKSSSSKPDSPAEAVPPSPRQAPGQRLHTGSMSLAEVLQADEYSDPGSPAMSPGLPLSPRPVNVRPPMHSPPLSPRNTGTFPSGPLSPRPPRQPIPMPPNTPLATPAVASIDQSLMSPKEGVTSPTVVTTPTERTKIFRGLITEEFPDLLLAPNALPSIAIRVASSRMKPSRASLISLTQLEEDPVFTLAVISRADRSELWRLEKDSASLSKLDQRLKQCPAFTARTPDKSLFSGHAPAKVDARRAALEHYMEEVLNTPLDPNTALELCKYLSRNALPPNVDELGAGSGAREGSSHMIGPDGRPIRSGYLTKRGKNFGGWKSRFFLLDGPLLKYYETPGGAHLGTIRLQNAQIVRHSQSGDNHSPPRGPNSDEMDNNYRHAFRILEPKKKDLNSHVKHVLCAENDKERDFWVNALLQWTDYRENEDEEPAQTSRSNAARSRKSMPPPRSHHQTQDSDTLVGVRYDSTQHGDVPQLGGRPKTSGASSDHLGHHYNNSDSMTPKLISGPKDPQPIADLAAWGNKTGLTAPTSEEKKVRKRSFFGFGSKTRSNSDGQDSIPSVGDGFSTTAPSSSGYHGPAHQVFGSTLAEAVRFSPPHDVDVPLPSVVYRCIQFLEHKDAILEEGIFRLSGSSIVIKGLRERFNVEGDVNLVTDDQFYDIHAVASLLKLYLRELPSTILTRELHLEFLGTTELVSRLDKVAALSELVQRLPLANATLLKYLIAFLIKIINNSDMNKMPVRNVGIVFSPTLNIPAQVFAMFLQNYEPIFGIAPEEYELPSANADRESNRPVDSPIQFDPPPPRPSTSSGSASPHRQPRLDSMSYYHNNRSTPTPPLISHRGTPTPPLGRQGHDSPRSTTQSLGQRPGTESASGSPTVSEAYNLYSSNRGAASQQSPVEEPSPGGLTVQDPSANSRRRESVMFMGNMLGLQPQSSKSRLREETRF